MYLVTKSLKYNRNKIINNLTAVIQSIIAMDTTGTDVLAALVVVLQLLSSVIKIGTVSITLTLIPIVVGAAFYGPGAGAILGTVFGLVVYINSATGADTGGNLVFLANPFLCAVVCIGKGTLSVWCAARRGCG